MKISSTDPTVHRQREQQIIQHVEKLLNDERLRIDTTMGRRPVTAFIRDVTRGERATDLKRLMSEMNLPDRALQNQMPIGEMLEVALTQKKMFVLTETVGRLRVVCVSPTRALLRGEEPAPMSGGDVAKLLASMPPSLGGVPMTVVVISTSGFTVEAHETADRRADRTIILLEPNGAGGWTATGPIETKSLADLFDPEAEEQKRHRIRDQIEQDKSELVGSGISADKLAARTLLPIQLVEAELKEYARANAGLNAKRLDGRVVLFREGSAPVSATPRASAETGGSDMPLMDRIKALFARKGENEKKISFLSERRTALSQQRDRVYEDMAAFEQQESALKRQFQEATGAITKRRVTTQLVQLRKDIDRRQQLLSVLNQQIDVVSTHLHNLELVQQGHSAKLPDTDEITADAVKAEEMLAELQADAELTGTLGRAATAGMTEEERAMYEELERESSGGNAKEKTAASAEVSSLSREPVARESHPVSTRPIASPAAHASDEPVASEPAPSRRAEPEAG
jgi:hypothetical protein